MIEATPAELANLSAERAEWTVFAFMTHPQASHDEMVALLDSIELPLPAHACAMVPLAFGRQLLDGLVSAPSTYQAHDGEHAFADDPLFVAARERARQASREELEAIAMRSSEVIAVNKALHAGSRPEDLVLATTFVPSEPDRTPRSFGGTDRTVAQMVRAHGADFALDVRVTPKRVDKQLAMLQLDVMATHEDRSIIESYAGVGSTILAAQKEALTKLMQCSLHVFIAVLAGRDHCRDHVDWESWREFDMCFSGVLRQFAQEPAFDLRTAVAAIRDSLPPLSAELHWGSIFLAIKDGRVTGHQITLDNEPHAAGLEVAQRWPWPQVDAFYTLRHFFMLVPAQAAR